MNHHERRHVRHALGLENKVRKSYRNRYHCALHDAERIKIWLGMVKKGYALQHGGAATDSDVRFSVTLAGATRVLRKGESLDGEDFLELGCDRRLTLVKN